MTLSKLQDCKLKIGTAIDSWSEVERELAVIRLREMGLTVGRARRSLASRLFERHQDVADRPGVAGRAI